MSDYLKGKTVLVIGASQGIGLAAAKKFGEQGARVFLAARSLDVIEKQSNLLIKQGVSATALHCDVTQYQSVVKCVETVLATDSLDFVVNSAGTIDPLAHLINSDPDLWAKAVDVNLKGSYNVIRACAPHMRSQGGGTIINLSSGAANSILEGWSHYCSTKAAAKKLTEVAHKELSHYNIHVIGLSPGTVATEMMKKIRDAKINVVSNLDWSSHISPESVALGIVYLCGPEGGHYSGTDFSLKTEEGRKLVGLE
ncbi:SDR family oxidoreductase [Alteromonas sp. 5E99-2]|uniref:SDR family oxidoreductase n=1 Tax=Alteromonas sp. 5E99-2 TaxID=2817683 RepID=UPI001A998AD6|nr:SDR family oxidoreductase [Alteromonas sp. 5E99-2]MBO1256201.1 SDR family oxidoreductase [Alteromonas sp. 5E99-2]